ncbi:MAG: hypothetical protein IJ213_08000, partial [Bacteroidales bacterium]|nr:hypothetical protein [Bacteroidales bacterium]
MAIVLSLSGWSQLDTYDSVTVQESGSTQGNGSAIPGWYGYHKSVLTYVSEELEGLTPGSAITGLAFNISTNLNGTGAAMKIYLAETSENGVDA